MSKGYRRRALIPLALAALSACAHGPRVDDSPGGAEGATSGGGGGGLRPGGLGRAGSPLVDQMNLYQRMGLLAVAEPLSFVGNTAFLAGPHDTTHVLVNLSLPNRSLTFAREGDRYRATYQVQLDLRQGAATVRHVEASEVVRVASFKETSRGDESVIFQQVLSVPAGQYVLAISIRDAGSARTASEETLLAVPRLSGNVLSTPVTVYEATPRSSTDSIPRLVPSPRSTVVFGRDTLVPVYVEGYGAAAAGGAAHLPVTLAVRSDKGSTLWTDAFMLDRRGESLYGGVINVPVSQLGVGVSTLVLWRTDLGTALGSGRAPSVGDSVRTPVFVTFGDELPVASFEEMLSYLRYFTTAARLQALRDTAPGQRAAAWAAFLRETDPVVSTPQNEALRDYFARIQTAVERFREEGNAGWLTDRGRVFVSLGEPDQIYEQGGADNLNQRGRAQVWQFREHGLELVFIDQTGFGRWRLTSSSEAEFEGVVRRIQAAR